MLSANAIKEKAQAMGADLVGVAEADSPLKLIDIWREKTITMSGSLNKPNEFKSMELSVYGFSFGQKISILYGGEKASFICFDFTMQR